MQNCNASWLKVAETEGLLPIITRKVLIIVGRGQGSVDEWLPGILGFLSALWIGFPQGYLFPPQGMDMLP